MKIFHIVISLFLSISQVGLSQWIVYNPYNTKGIQGTMVSSGLAANDDKLWFGTDQGVACFDPEYSVWTNYNTSNWLNTNFIYQVFEDKEGGIWAATNGSGVSRYSNNGWTNYSIKDGLSYNVVRAISQSPDGTMWFGTYGHGICTYRAATGFKKYASGAIANSYVLSILALSDDLILIGTHNEGLIILDNDTVCSLVNENELSGNKVFSIFRDHNDKIWIATEKGAQQYDPATRSVSACPDSLAGKTIYGICENHSGELIFTSNDKIFTVSNGSWSSFIPDNLLNSTAFYSAFYDKDGIGWFGSSNQGLFKKSGPSWYNYFNSSGLNTTYLTGLCEDKDQNLWFTSYESVYRFDGQNWNNVTQKAGISNANFTNLIADSKGNIWCTSGSGLYKYDGNTWTNFAASVYFDNGYLSSLVLGKDGSLWVGSYYNGVYRYDGSNWTHFTTSHGMATNNIKALAIFPDGKLAVVSEYAEISIYDGNTWTVDNTLYGNNYILDMTIDVDNNIWLATYNGILRHTDSETQSYYTDDYDQYNYVEFIKTDKEGQIWAGLYYTGLLLFSGSNWYTFSTSDGLSSNYLKDILIDSRGRYWVIADNGINMSASFTHVEEPGSISPNKIVACPNPFSGSLDIQYSSVMTGFADIHFFSADGRLVKQYNQQKVDIGENTFHFESHNWPDGLLFCKIILPNSTESIKLLKVSTY